MATFVLIPGAGGDAWYWHRVVPLLERAGHSAVAVELPGADPKSGFDAYADRVIEAIGARHAVTLVAQSLGGFTAAWVCARASDRIARLVFVNAMIPLPGETAGAWWDDTGSTQARIAAAKRAGYGAEFDAATYFLHDLPQDVAEEAENHDRHQSKTVFGNAAELEAWPDIPIHVVVGEDDRFFPEAFQARVARERLGRDVDRIPGGHLVALSHPRELADLLCSYVER